MWTRGDAMTPLATITRPDTSWPIGDADPFGLRPLFWASTRDTIVVAPTIQALLDRGIARTLDDAALAVFIRAGFFVGDDTPFSAIRAVPPCPRVSWRSDRGELVSTGPIAAPLSVSRTAAESRFGELVDAAVARAATAAAAPIAVLLSGGHDSRHLLFALIEAGHVPERCVTVVPYPPSADDDLAIARRVASTVGVRHVVLPHRRDRVGPERAKNAITSWCADEHAQFLPLRDHFAGSPAHVFDGLGGDVLSQSQRLAAGLHHAFITGAFGDVADRVLGKPDDVEPALRHLLSPGAVHRLPRQLAAARVALEAARYAGAPNPIASFFFFTRARREIALAPYALLGCPVATPFTDPDVAGFLLGLPFDIVADRRFHTATMARRFPQFADIPFGGKRLGRDDRAAVRRWAAELLGATLRGDGELVKTGAVAARCVRAMVTGASAHLWFLPRIVHLLDVAAIAAGRATTRRDSPSTAPAAA